MKLGQGPNFTKHVSKKLIKHNQLLLLKNRLLAKTPNSYHCCAWYPTRFLLKQNLLLNGFMKLGLSLVLTSSTFLMDVGIHTFPRHLYDLLDVLSPDCLKEHLDI